jgi:hypothetical protein
VCARVCVCVFECVDPVVLVNLCLELLQVFVCVCACVRVRVRVRVC